MSQVGTLFSKFGRNRIAGKLALAVATLVVPAVVLSYLLYRSIDVQVEFARKELVGADYFNSIRATAERAVEHRRLVAEYAAGLTDNRGQLDKAQADVEAALRAAEEKDKRLPGQTHTPKAWEKTNGDWKKLTAQLGGVKPGNAEKAVAALTAYDAFLGSFREVMVEVADASNITLDPEYASYGLGLVSLKAVDSADMLGQVAWRSLLAATSKDKTLSADQKAELFKTLGKLQALGGDIDSAIEDINEERKDIAAVMEPKLKAREEKTEDFLSCVEKEVLLSNTVTMPAQQVLDESSAAVGTAFTLYDFNNPLLVKELERRNADFRTTLTLGGAAIGIGLLLALFVVYTVARGFTRQIKAYLDLFAVVDRGEYAARVQKLTSDELGDMAGSLNQVLETTDNLIKKQKEDYDGLQRSIMKLLDDVSGTANGDLTREAEVTADATGAIADSFNYMIEQLRDIIGNVQLATLQVSSAASQIHTSAGHLADGSENQAEQIVTTTSAIDEMAASIRQVSENAATSSAVAQQALTTAKQGNTAVRNTIDGMGRIREQAQETAKRIKRLGETSQEIGQIVQLIDDIADRTSILALNASIQAAAAGEAGRGFAVVAEEVERLAIRSTDATKKIAALVKAIQGETNEAVNAMEKSIQEVVGGSKVAQDAGRSLEEIETVSAKLADLIQQITLASKQQARGSEALAKNMGDISQITQQTASGTKQTAESVNSLARLADELRNSVSAFKLPDAHMVRAQDSGRFVLAK